MKTLNQYIKEKLIINKYYQDNMIVVKSFDELRKIIEDRYEKLGPGTEQKPIDFNDIDFSNLDSFLMILMQEYLKKQNLNTLIYRVGMYQILSQCVECFMIVKN